MHVKLKGQPITPPKEEIVLSRESALINGEPNGSMQETESNSDISIDGDGNDQMIERNGKI